MAAQVPGTNILQLFYRGTDNVVRSRLRNNDGTWSSEQRIGGVLNGDPTAIAYPDTSEILALFYRGTDNSLWTRWLATTWSNEQRLGGTLNSDPVAVQVATSIGPTPGGGTARGLVALFYRGADDGLWTHWRGYEGSWYPELGFGHRLGEPSGFNGKPLAAFVPDPNSPMDGQYPFWLQPFYRDSENRLWTRSRSNDDGSWSDQQYLGGVNGDPIAAVVTAA